MIKNSAKLKKFNRDLLAKENLSFPAALRIYEALYQEARALGVFNSQNIMEGLETTLRVTRAIHQFPHV
jgi:hypothetical protein